jgi:hypothetical protein
MRLKALTAAPPSTVEEWDAYVASAPNIADAMDRIEQAVVAGVNFALLVATQNARLN